MKSPSKAKAPINVIAWVFRRAFAAISRKEASPRRAHPENPPVENSWWEAIHEAAPAGQSFHA